MPENCTKCDDPIRDTTVTFEKKPYHPECFVCHQCQKKLSGKAIYKHEGHNYDQECYGTFHAKRCAKCYEVLTDPKVSYVQYDGKTFHPDCFTCSRCDKSLAKQQFYLDGENKLCEKCH
uniref:LIM zinc-binding domain-containing protein n=1 Tax=Clytia hemisphaerica TaxID=252671 RepID=A0A7M5X8E1_9CNID|eukprot:TCONS_00049487-protein